MHQAESPARTHEQDLIRKCLAGNSEALRVLVDLFQGPIFGLCYRMVRQRQDAEDITQDSLLRMVRSLRNWDPARALAPWVLAIAANRCRTFLARKARRPPLAAEVREAPDARPAAHDLDLQAELERALNQLRPEYRTVVLMFHERQLTYDEIGETMGRPVGTIKTWLHRARVELARELAVRGFEHAVPKNLVAGTSNATRSP